MEIETAPAQTRSPQSSLSPAFGKLVDRYLLQTSSLLVINVAELNRIVYASANSDELFKQKLHGSVNTNLERVLAHYTSDTEEELQNFYEYMQARRQQKFSICMMQQDDEQTSWTSFVADSSAFPFICIACKDVSALVYADESNFINLFHEFKKLELEEAMLCDFVTDTISSLHGDGAALSIASGPSFQPSEEENPRFLGLSEHCAPSGGPEFTLNELAITLGDQQEFGELTLDWDRPPEFERSAISRIEKFCKNKLTSKF
ncbi:hypothetical protein GUITHDRAFT_152736 [Guillardia theta CCMP2712]|uniref:Uncharacterized protein n=1 Tax=Guillardia theta (strain CCMP2712) TaxID=905079 RepID=L1JAE9_GUITC|nr:hypothetical protein GUITHDRAFT_152736 [Guillardia theta CCMP2712]EKX45506.1 hypothetical protein GUITHDRAFT_152736 [Guillardia theta CCMP2712]|mmetsp:Transcript_10767/g.36174  ORF Transcript_10767/g.36174 Transcript_10767/m.36174 type:complete len:261 (-) Transcript_10767:76-858(-)|eukprot:XP_005832486.1 hypothetical protein GUITHDRAFT_152736 [Guillardia theta CCMP2712]